MAATSTVVGHDSGCYSMAFVLRKLRQMTQGHTSVRQPMGLAAWTSTIHWLLLVSTFLNFSYCKMRNQYKPLHGIEKTAMNWIGRIQTLHGFTVEPGTLTQLNNLCQCKHSLYIPLQKILILIWAPLSNIAHTIQKNTKQFYRKFTRGIFFLYHQSAFGVMYLHPLVFIFSLWAFKPILPSLVWFAIIN